MDMIPALTAAALWAGAIALTWWCVAKYGPQRDDTEDDWP